MDEFFKWLTANPVAANVFIGAFGILVLSIVGIYLIAFVQGRETSLWPPSIGARPDVPSSTTPSASKGRLTLSQPQKPKIDSAQASPALSDAKLVQVSPPIEPARFLMLDLPRREPINVYGWPHTPLGVNIFYDVPFFLQPVTDASTNNIIGHHAIDIRPTKAHDRAIVEMPVHVMGLQTIDFLLSAGNGWVMSEGILFLGKRIGYVELVFVDDSTQRIDLTLGKNIREWFFGWNANLVNRVDFSITKPAWVSHDQSRRFDFLSTSVFNGPKDLAMLRVVAVFEDASRDRMANYPSIIISAITCEKSS